MMRGMSESPIVKLTRVVKRYAPDAPPVLCIPSFELARGAQVALAGPSGTGKTTLLNVIAGILAPDEGEVEVDGVALSSLSGAALDRFRGTRIGLVFQTFNLLQGFTALQNVMIPMMFGTTPRRDHESRARRLLERVQMLEHANLRPSQLSVGQQQRVAIARALANDPPLILADEPAAQLDEQNARNAIELLKEVCTEARRTLLVVAHDHLVLSQFSDEVDIRDFKQDATPLKPR